MDERTPQGTHDLPPDERASLLREFWLFLRETRKWWLVPLILVVLLVGVLLVLGTSPLSPLIYSLF